MHVAHGLWTLEESEFSSTWRELKAVALVLESIAPKLAHLSVHWFTDNQNVVKIISVGSTKEHLQAVAVKIFNLCFSKSVKLEPERVPWEHNELADYYSRVVDSDVWGGCLKHALIVFGGHTQLTDLLVRTTQKLSDSIPGSGTQVQKLLMLLQLIGVVKITIGVPQCI